VEVFRRTLAARLAPLLVAGGALALLMFDLAGGRLTFSWWSLITATVAVVAGAGAVMAIGDEVVVGESGIRLRHRYLGRHREVAFADMQDVRVVQGRTGTRPRALFVIPQAGPRVILDSLSSMERLQELLEAGRSRSRPADL
jgi:hypothetical protein